MTADGRRALAYPVLICLAGAGLAFFATTRVWAVEVTARPAPLPALRADRTGADLLPWLPALALVGLAGAGAVLATGGRARRLVGLLLVLVGAGMLAGALVGLVDSGPAGTGPGWPLAALLGAALTALAGALTAARGHRWPTMGARYERSPLRSRPDRARPADRLPADRLADSPPTDRPPADRIGAGSDRIGGGSDRAAPTAAGSTRVEGRRTVEAWDALDRGEDPTD
nr:Trp biosynthesis-associated membrane protein [Micromonospora sp. DSM 115978]